MIEPAIWNIRAHRHAPFPSVDPITLTDTLTGVPIDITGATITMEVRWREGQAGDPLLSETLSVLNGPAGQFSPPTFTEADHEALTAAPTADNKSLQSELVLRHDVKAAGITGWPASVIVARGFYYVQTGVTL